MNALTTADSLAAAHPAMMLTGPAAAMAAIDAAKALLPTMEAGSQISATVLRAAMTEAFKGSDSEGVWDWKTAYDACEIASVLFIRKYGAALKRKVPPASALPEQLGEPEPETTKELLAG